jgi:drug/metabolite transporter (DMT)-like permease
MLYIFAALFFYTVAILLGAYAARHAGPAVVSTVTNGIAFVAAGAFAASELLKRGAVNQRAGIMAAIAGGIAIGIFTVALNKAFSTDKVAIVSPIVFGGSIFLTAILGYFIFKERITPFQAAGLVFLLIGMSLIVYAKATGK